MGGCIVGECPICEEWIYEDEWEITGDIMHHEDCKVTKFVTQFSKLSIDEQKSALSHNGIAVKIEEAKELAITLLSICEKMEGKKNVYMP